MNFLMKLLWRWQGRRKLNHDDPVFQYIAISKLGEVGSTGDLDLLLEKTEDRSQIVRNATSNALKIIISKNDEDEEFLREIEDKIIDKFNSSKFLSTKVSLVEVMESISLQAREELLGPMVLDSENDLLYAIIRALADTKNNQILDDVLEASQTEDLVLRRIVLETWYDGVASRELDDILDYCTPRLHFLIRAVYELQTDGKFLRKALSYADQRDLPHPKAYPDFIIRYLTELLGNWEYDPEAYRTLHAIMVPSYFTFDEATEAEEDRPFLIL